MYITTVKSGGLKIGGVVIIESPCSRREESEYKPVRYEVKLNYVYLVQDRDILTEQSP